MTLQKRRRLLSLAMMTVDTDTLFVDSTNNRVGIIGTTSPSDGQLHIKGTDTTNQVIIENDDDEVVLHQT